MTPREQRLRARIDQLLDERERLEQRCADLETRVRLTRSRLRTARMSRDLWRHRAVRA